MAVRQIVDHFEARSTRSPADGDEAAGANEPSLRAVAAAEPGLGSGLSSVACCDGALVLFEDAPAGGSEPRYMDVPRAAVHAVPVQHATAVAAALAREWHSQFLDLALEVVAEEPSTVAQLQSVVVQLSESAPHTVSQPASPRAGPPVCLDYPQLCGELAPPEASQPATPRHGDPGVAPELSWPGAPRGESALHEASQPATPHHGGLDSVVAGEIGVSSRCAREDRIPPGARTCVLLTAEAQRGGSVPPVAPQPVATASAATSQSTDAQLRRSQVPDARVDQSLGAPFGRSAPPVASQPVTATRAHRDELVTRDIADATAAHDQLVLQVQSATISAAGAFQRAVATEAEFAASVATLESHNRAARVAVQQRLPRATDKEADLLVAAYARAASAREADVGGGGPSVASLRAKADRLWHDIAARCRSRAEKHTNSTPGSTSVRWADVEDGDVAVGDGSTDAPVERRWHANAVSVERLLQSEVDRLVAQGAGRKALRQARARLRDHKAAIGSLDATVSSAQ